MKTLEQIQKEFSARLVTLNTGVSGLRGGLHCDVKAVDGDDTTMDFIASDSTVDRYNEVIDQNGWQLDNFRANPVIPDSHDYSSIGKILGRAISVSVVGGKLVNRVQFAMDNPLGAMACKMARGGFIKSQSVGFIPLEWTNGAAGGVGQGNGGQTGSVPDRTYTKAELLEISLVAVPANPGATIGAALKSGAIGKSDLTELYGFLKQFCSSPAVAADHTRSLGAANNDEQLLRLARDLNAVLRRAK
jgi:hypothetical protein